MKGQAIHHPALIKSALCAALAVLCGLLLWSSSLGEPWVNASYDYLFRFGTHSPTNSVVLVLMDNDAFDHFHQTRGRRWDRELHTQLLNKLADDGCELVIFDSFFKEPGDPAVDDALAAAMHRQKHMVLMAEQSAVNHPGLAGVMPILPDGKFLSAVGTNWGIAWLAPDLDGIVRKHWPFPSPGPCPDLPRAAAQLSGAHLDAAPQERWLRYYAEHGPWTVMSYRYALAETTNYFRGKTVFIGTQPKTTLPDGEPDEFSTPFTRWTGEVSGGVEILATVFLNLMNDDWLSRPGGGFELVVLTATGILLGVGFSRFKPLVACGAAVLTSAGAAIAAVAGSYYSHYWFPWLLISGAQVPCALVASLSAGYLFARPAGDKKLKVKLPRTPGYKLIQPPIGEGAYGKVWLAQDNAGQWRALKAIYLASFGENTAPFDREFDGITRYKSVSGKHPGLLRVDFVSEKQDGYFYYVMELADSLHPDWQNRRSAYRPHDLAAERARMPGQRFPIGECVRIGIVLAEALDYLHRQGLTHRDIKPQNVIFVNGQPKLADLGLVADIRPQDQIKTFVGTPGYMPPPPEPPGTPQADIFALGMVLYVLSTGRNPAAFPDISTTLVVDCKPGGFISLNAIILKACQPDPAVRYASAAEMHQALLALAGNAS